MQKNGNMKICQNDSTYAKPYRCTHIKTIVIYSNDSLTKDSSNTFSNRENTLLLFPLFAFYNTSPKVINYNFRVTIKS